MSEHKVCRRQLERVQGENVALKAEVERLQNNLIAEKQITLIRNKDYLAEKEKREQAEARLVKVVDILSGRDPLNAAAMRIETAIAAAKEKP